MFNTIISQWNANDNDEMLLYTCYSDEEEEGEETEITKYWQWELSLCIANEDATGDSYDVNQ